MASPVPPSDSSGVSLSLHNNIVKNGGSFFSSFGFLWVLGVFVFKTPLYQCFMENLEREKVAAPGPPPLKFFKSHKAPLPVLRLCTLSKY